MGDAVPHETFVDAPDALRPLVALFKEAVLHDQVPEVVYVGGVLVEVVRAVGPDSRRKPAKDAVPDRDVTQNDPVVPLVREEADAEADLAPRVVFVVLVVQRVPEVAVLDPDELLGRASSE